MLYYTLCSYFQLVIFIFILTLVLYHLLYEVVLYMISIYVCMYICMPFCMYILFCNRAPWKNSLTEWSTLYKYIWKKKKKKKKKNPHIYINISCKCDTNRAGHFTLDAYASRPVACPKVWDGGKVLQFSWRQLFDTTGSSELMHNKPYVFKGNICWNINPNWHHNALRRYFL